jgi:sulfur relay protein TusB/DsrH
LLITLSKSPPFENSDSILEIAKRVAEKGEKVAILLIQDACAAATMSDYCDKLALNEIEVYALKADCQARGLTEKADRRVKLVDYKQWVKLVMTEHKNIISWTS